MSKGKVKHTTVEDVIVDTSVDDSTPIDIKHANRGILQIPSGSGVTEVTFYTSNEAAGTYLQLGDPLSVSYPKQFVIPEGVFAAPWLKIQASAGTDSTCLVMLV